MDVKKAKYLVLFRFLGLRRTTLEHEMVEAAGIEPASISAPHTVLHT